MRLKSFTANTMKDAMQMVREELGDEAIIVATREEKSSESGKQLIHLTAAIEADHMQEREATPSDQDWMYADDDNEAMVLEEVTDTMLRHAVSEDVLDEIVSCASITGMNEPRLAMLSALESIFKFAPLPTTPTETPLMLVGPPGTGKTLAAAKIAARGAMNNMDISVITTDTERAGGREQLEAFTKLLDIELRTADSPAELREVLLEVKQADQIIIDTAGTNPFDTEAIKSLAQYIGVCEMDVLLTLPAGSDADEAGEVARIFSNIGTLRLLPTRLDVARRLGSILSAAHQGGLIFADMSATSKVADGLSQLTPKRLTQLLMPRAENARMHKAQKVG